MLKQWFDELHEESERYNDIPENQLAKKDTLIRWLR